MSEQEMIERYIYEVVRRVPSEAREEIRMEIGALIEDMQNGEGLSVQAVLEKLGIRRFLPDAIAGTGTI